MAAKKEASPAAEKKGTSSGRLILFIGIGLLAVLGSVGATLFLTGTADQLLGGGQAAAEAGAAPAAAPQPVAPAEPPKYLPLDPPFVVNFQDQGVLRYLQINVSVMARSQGIIDAVDTHRPQIRDKLIDLFGNQQYETLGTPEGKDALRSQALEEVQAILEKEIGVPGVEAVYFTNFVMQ